MNGLGDLADALYDRFLLRDLFGKAVPGATLLMAVASGGQWKQVGNALEGLTALDLPTQLLLLGLAWAIGVMIQEVGHWAAQFPIVSLFSSRLWPEKYDHNTARYELRQRVLDAQGNDAERLVVLKEATGNLCFSLVISAFVVLVATCGASAWEEWSQKVLVLCLLVGAFASSRVAGVFRERQFDYWEQLSGRAEKSR